MTRPPDTDPSPGVHHPSDPPPGSRRRQSTDPRIARVLRGLREPRAALSILVQLGRGWWYKTTLPLRGIRFQAGRNFRVAGRLIVRGPGRVIFGDNVRVEGVVTPWTYDADAVISIGSDSFVNGTRFGCQRRITIGPRAILADARLLDTDFHSTRVDRHDPAAPVRVAPITIAENVWIAAGAGVLPGTTIGENSVVGFGAVCAGSYPANKIIAGNPATVVRSVEGAPAE